MTFGAHLRDVEHYLQRARDACAEAVASASPTQRDRLERAALLMDAARLEVRLAGEVQVLDRAG